ncbi:MULTISPECIES: hypothetical protein [Cyanophyceae]|uniref:hypothetical protein n=1 Tax=Cyanophyceae TaxID=3028117 RepID=UPI0016875652|nr:hypothetical protein [Trichocoleus sp. FACHB-40]MBD2006352.1 hypothetical protein [Trichocoleus sp. FACHB-40]
MHYRKIWADAPTHNQPNLVAHRPSPLQRFIKEVFCEARVWIAIAEGVISRAADTVTAALAASPTDDYAYDPLYLLPC